MDTTALYQKYKACHAVSTDTRTLAPGAMFFALKGPRFNANTLAREALDKGALYAVVDEPPPDADRRYLKVDDSLRALQQLARHHRRQHKLPVVALTGSNGKTTTKELTHAVLQKKYAVIATAGNLNNHIGTPLTLLRIDADTEIAVIEMGANHVGEIAALCEIAAPTHGAITNIGQAHTGTFGGFHKVVRAKQELYRYLADKERAVWVNSQDALLAKLSAMLKRPLFYPAAGDYAPCRLVAADPFIAIATPSNKTARTQLVGEYNFENIALALCIGKFFGVPEDDAVAAVAAYKPGNMRSQVVVKDTNTIVLDAYNANPTSMEAAIKTLAHMNADRRVAILGDMHELGTDSERSHRKVIEWIKKYRIDTTCLCGPLFEQAAAKEKSIHLFPSREKLAEWLQRHPIRHAAVLIKASRGVGLEYVLNFI